MAQDIRLYTPEPLAAGTQLMLPQPQSHYLANVMRCKAGDMVSLFNGTDGQWRAEISSVEKKAVTLTPLKQTRHQSASPDVWLVFAPLKNKTELVIEKATELGVTNIIPVVTQSAVVRSVNLEKLAIHAVEASEQCERLDIPTLETHKDLSYLLGAWPKDRVLLYGDESGGGESLANVLPAHKDKKLAVLIGPEGGFTKDEFDMLKACNFTQAFGLGPRILRADTAAVAALSCVMSQVGDWHAKPHFITHSVTGA